MTVDTPAREYNPFSFFVGYRSAIQPLGGAIQGPDPKYGFHTEYDLFRPGPVKFHVVLDDLVASHGELSLHVNAFVPGSGKDASVATTSKVDMAELSRQGGRLEVPFYAVEGVSYAIHGFFPGGTDARATHLTITVEELGIVELDSVPAEALEPTRLGRTPVQQARHLVDSKSQPLFCDPVSQAMTGSQVREDAFAHIGRDIDLSGQGARATWRKLFLLQALSRYGFLAGGGRALNFGDADADLALFLASRHIAVTLGEDASRRPPIARDSATQYLSRRAMDFTDIPLDLRGFDFIWTDGLANHLGGGSARQFIVNAMDCLRPGGLAIHMIDLDLENPASPSASEGPVPLRRDEVSTIAVTLISRSHEVAQLNFGDAAWLIEGRGELPRGKGEAGGIPFGLIARRKKTL